MTKLRNNEKAVIIDALKDKYSLPQLLKIMCMSKSNYYYREAVVKHYDKYQELRKK